MKRASSRNECLTTEPNYETRARALERERDPFSVRSAETARPPAVTFAGMFRRKLRQKGSSGVGKNRKNGERGKEGVEGDDRRRPNFGRY